jgi:dienelactone hydrolase
VAYRWTISLLLLVLTLPVFGADPPAPRDVTISAPDATQLKATYYAAAKPGPAVLLLHMCNTTRKSWEPVAAQLSAAGIHALTLDYRGFGESGGETRDKLTPQQAQQVQTEKWPGDVDAAYAFLLSQPGVDKTRIGAGGGSCGVNQAVLVARRHPDVKSLVLLAGGTNQEGRKFLEQTHWLPIFAAAAADDQFDSNAPQSMQWLLALSGNPRNKFSGFQDGKHGTEIFGPHPELPKQIVAWYQDTLVKAPADPKVAVTPRTSPMSEFWATVEAPGGVSKAVQMFRDARKKDPQAFVFPEGIMNQLGYERMQAGQTKEAIELLKLNNEAYPNSANTYDSLGDAYLADGQNELALQASQKAIEMLAADKGNEDLKKAVRTSAEQKIAKLKANAPK